MAPLTSGRARPEPIPEIRVLHDPVPLRAVAHASGAPLRLGRAPPPREFARTSPDRVARAVARAGDIRLGHAGRPGVRRLGEEPNAVALRCIDAGFHRQLLPPAA